jgi:hypothetical protein
VDVEKKVVGEEKADETGAAEESTVDEEWRDRGGFAAQYSSAGTRMAASMVKSSA